MGNLHLSVAVGDYDRTRPLIDGDVRIDGVDPVFLRLSPEEIFFRAFRTRDFDICELSMSSTVVKIANSDCPYVPIPVFPSRAFRHTSLYINATRGISRPEDLRGRRVGLGEYQLTANVWARALLEDDYGVRPGEIDWVRGAFEDLGGRPEKISLDLPPDIRITDAPADRTLAQMLADGEIDALVGPRMPSTFGADGPVRWLFDDPLKEAQDYYRRTGIFPIMHLVGIRRELVDTNPWLPATVQKAFEASKAECLSRLSDTSATKVTLPFVEDQLHRARRLMGADFWSYGVDDNRKVLDTFLDHHHRQGLSRRRVSVDELFHPSTYATARI
ncbi:ABC transporter substrate-binding protein [Pseudoruegeria sp. HB172150]|uniref:ABC transporter substrate-binding protein n=1 Tax=Pseudoruegeria sp. HB172150 TaxID=2721164 RepID=UPI001557DAC8|nr:ABC transporter substrate-binding protein [Pseudoruegeria sp. HB172150]